MKTTTTIITSLIIGGLLALVGTKFLQDKRLNLTPAEVNSIVASHQAGQQQALQDVVKYFENNAELKLGNLTLIIKPKQNE